MCVGVILEIRSRAMMSMNDHDRESLTGVIQSASAGSGGAQPPRVVQALHTGWLLRGARDDQAAGSST
jgi:hypothetical protein